jgi:hypothetical protein
MSKLEYEAAIVEAEKAARLTGESPFFLASLGCCYAAAGRRDEAQKILAQLERISSRRWVSPYWTATVNAPLADRRDEVLRDLEAARLEHAPWMAWVALLPYFDHIRSDPRFDEHLRRIIPSK